MKPVLFFIFVLVTGQVSFASCTGTVVCGQGVMETCTAVSSEDVLAQCFQYDKVFECRETYRDANKPRKSSIYLCCDVNGRVLSTRDPNHANGVCMHR